MAALPAAVRCVSGCPSPLRPLCLSNNVELSHTTPPQPCKSLQSQRWGTRSPDWPATIGHSPGEVNKNGMSHVPICWSSGWLFPNITDTGAAPRLTAPALQSEWINYFLWFLRNCEQKKTGLQKLYMCIPLRLKPRAGVLQCLMPASEQTRSRFNTPE